MNKKTASALLLLFLAFTLRATDVREPLRRVEPRDITPGEIAAKLRNGRNIFLRTAVFDPATERPDYESVGLGKRARSLGEYAVVQFKSDDPGTRAELERLGVKFFGYLPDHAYQVRIPSTMRASVQANAAVRWVGEYEAGFKVHPRLWPSAKAKMRAIRVVPFGDASVDKTIYLIQKAVPDVVVTKKLDGKWGRFAELAAPAGREDDLVRAAAAIEGVQWIEPNDERRFDNSASSRAIQGNTATDAGRTIFSHNITGTGQIIAVADSGLDSDMCFFRNFNGRDAVTDASDAPTEAIGPLFPQNKVIGYWVQEGAAAYDAGGADFHGTHTAGTVAGDNFAHLSSSTDAGFDSGDGMAPNAQILFQDIGKNDASGTLTSGGDPYAMFLQALRGGARVHSNSYGSRSEGAYTVYEQIVDQFLFDHDEMTIVFSAGNNGRQGAGTISSPANGKNVITVGATGAGTNGTVAVFSSHGPTSDGRIKPDITAPGVSIFSANGDEVRGNGNCFTTGKQGTSMSAPTVAGGAALLRQYFADGFYPGGTKNPADTVNASATLVKGVLLNGTLATMDGSKFGSNDFGANFGWGKIFLDNNLYFPGDSRRLRVWDLVNSHGLQTGETRSFTVSVATGQELRATLVWTDPEGTLGAAKALVNDLDLTVTKDGNTFAGNVFNADGVSVTGGTADRLNNVEQVRLTEPTGGTYTITVRANSVPGNGRAATNRQGFALVVSAATCGTAISAAPGNVTATTNPTRGIDIRWTNPSGSTVTQVYRAEGSNPAPGAFRYIGSSNGTSFTDLRAQGGFTYTYRVRGADDCGEGPLSSTVTFTSTGLCDLIPHFEGISTAHADGTNCRIILDWSPATASCPLATGTIRYNVYRSTTPEFTPSGTPYATTTDTTYSDNNVASGTTYYYAIRAEDSSTASTGPHGGNEDTNTVRLFATAFGSPGVTGTFSDGAGDNGAFFSPDVPWQITRDQAHSGIRSYHHGPDASPHPNNTCAAISTPPLLLDANAELSYWARYNLEFQWDGVIVEISTNNGSTWSDLPPQGGYPDTLAQTEPAGAGGPVNACGYPKTKGAFTGPSGNVDLTPWTQYKSSLASFAGQTVRIRWRFTSDPATEFQGFYLDDVAITNTKLPGSCTPTAVKPVAGFNGPAVAFRGAPASFADTSTNTPTSWLWNFGDGGTSTERNPTHTYTTNGTFNVQLTVTNSQGSDSVTKTVLVKDPGPAKRQRSARH